MTMSPADPTLVLHAYLDGELDPAHALEFEQRLAADPALAAERDRIAALRQAIADKLPREGVPPGLAGRIEAAVGLTRAAPVKGRMPQRPTWRALAASVALALLVGSGSTWLALRGDSDPTADRIVASHMRALMAAQPIDVASSDRHTVKPWFNGRIPEAPRVVDLGKEGFTLVGGRIDVIGRVPVPTLVYRLRQHLISVSAIPAARAAAAPREIAGYNIVSWSDGGVAYWAVSDVAAADLETFAKAFRSASAEP